MLSRRLVMTALLSLALGATSLATVLGQDTLEPSVPQLPVTVTELALRRAVLPQQTVLQFGFTGWEVVEMGRTPHLGRRDQRQAERQVIQRCMERSEATAFANRRYPTLSGGEQSRVTLARVLAQETPVLLLDEPTASLDISHQQMVMEITRELAVAGSAVLAVLHDLNLAASYADRLAVLCQGRLVALDDPWATLTEGLLSEVFE